jgi:hypothetical protein
MLESVLLAGGLSPREAIDEWTGLLKECNEAQSIANREFEALNSRLLDLFTASTEESSSLR